MGLNSYTDILMKKALHLQKNKDILTNMVSNQVHTSQLVKFDFNQSNNCSFCSKNVTSSDSISMFNRVDNSINHQIFSANFCSKL